MAIKRKIVDTFLSQKSCTNHIVVTFLSQGVS